MERSCILEGTGESVGWGLGVESIGRQGQEGKKNCLESWIVFFTLCKHCRAIEEADHDQICVWIMGKIGGHVVGWVRSDAERGLGGCCICLQLGETVLAHWWWRDRFQCHFRDRTSRI